MNINALSSYPLNVEIQVLHLLPEPATDKLLNLMNEQFCWSHLQTQMLLHAISHYFIKEQLPLHLVRSFSENEINLMLAYTSTDIPQTYLREMTLRAHALYHDIKKVNHPLVLQVINLIHHQLYEPLFVSDLATKLNVSSTHLSTLFLKHYEQPLHQYILVQKIERAKHILTYTSNSTLAISIGLGFSSQSYFCQVFKRQTGINPTQYRLTKKEVLTS